MNTAVVTAPALPVHEVGGIAAGAAGEAQTREPVRSRARLRPQPPAEAPAQAQTLKGRRAGYVGMRRCLRAQEQAAPLSLVARIFGREPLHEEARSWYRAALGDLAVARELERLGPEWTVLHAVPAGPHGSDIDHLVIGPGGVFTLTSREHAGARIRVTGREFLVDGSPTEYIRRSLSEATSAAQRLSRASGGPIRIEPLLVVVRPDRLVLSNPAVPVVAELGLAAWLRAQKPIHSREAVAYYSMVAEDLATWRGDTHLEQERSAVERFERLRARVESAARRRTFWSVLPVLSAVVVPYLITSAAATLGSALVAG